MGIATPGIIVAVLVIALLWLAPEPLLEERCDVFGGREGQSISTQTSLWPPGTECTTTEADGTSTTSVYVPWGEWLVALLAVSFAVLFLEWNSRRAKVAHDPE